MTRRQMMYPSSLICVRHSMYQGSSKLGMNQTLWWQTPAYLVLSTHLDQLVSAWTNASPHASPVNLSKVTSSLIE